MRARTRVAGKGSRDTHRGVGVSVGGIVCGGGTSTIPVGRRAGVGQS